MSSVFGALLFEMVKKVALAAISKRVVYASEEFFARRRIEGRIEDSIAQVVERLVPFFQSDGVSDKQREILLDTLEHELNEILEDPQELFAASLDGQNVFDRRYSGRRFPQAIRDEALEDLYGRVFPQIASMICAYPPALEQWKVEGYREGFKRLDEIAAILGEFAGKINLLTSRRATTSDALRARVAQSLIQRVGFRLELIGLRGDRPDAVPLEKCFIVPQFARTIKGTAPEKAREIRIGSEADISSAFADGCVRALVVGAPGTGKSTWSQWLQSLVLTNLSGRLAVVVRLRDLVKGETLPAYQEIVRESAGPHLREEIDAGAVRGWCEAGAITFIIDGFDEVPPNKRDSVLAWVRDLDSAIGNAGLIVTSRPLTTTHLAGLSERWMRWEMLPFDETRITDYISRWYAHAPLLVDKSRDVDAAALAWQWVNDSCISPLVGTPLMLATILMVHHMDGELPRGRARLYERYIDGMLGLWDSRWGVPAEIDLSRETKKRILTRLALDFHLEEIEQLGDAEIRIRLSVILEQLGCQYSTSDVLNHLRERSGLLIGPGTWSFVHKNVGEFLVAAAIRDGDQMDSSGQRFDRMRLFRERHNDRWNAVLFFWAGLCAPGDLQSFMEQVAAQPGNEEFKLALGLFYDQLQPHRLTEPWKSDFLLQLLARGLVQPISGMDLFIISARPHGLDLNISVPNYFLRGFRQEMLFEAIEECVEESTITPDQAGISDVSLRFLVWNKFAIRPKTIDELRIALTGSSWADSVRDKWWAIAFDWGLARAAFAPEKISLAEYLHTLYVTVPEHAGKALFFLLSAVVRRMNPPNNPDDSKRGADFQQGIKDLLRAIESTRDRPLDTEWLTLSRQFDGGYVRPGEAFDLLDMFLVAVDTLAGDGWLSEDDLVANVRSYVKELQDRRDAS